MIFGKLDVVRRGMYKLEVAMDFLKKENFVDVKDVHLKFLGIMQCVLGKKLLTILKQKKKNSDTKVSIY